MSDNRKKLIAVIVLAAVLLALMITVLMLQRGAGDATALYGVGISEVMTSNSAYPDGKGVFCDWIELHNSSVSEADISGYKLTDDKNEAKYSFPSGTVIAPDGYLVLYCAVSGGSGYVPFGLSRDGGEEITLFSKENDTVSKVTTVALETNTSMAADAAGSWGVSMTPTPGYSNDETGFAAYTASMYFQSPQVVITELMQRNGATLADSSGNFPDWVELTNISDSPAVMKGWYLTDSETDIYSRLLPDVALEPGERVVVLCEPKGTYAGGVPAEFSLSSSGGVLTLSTDTGRISSRVEFGAAEEDESWAYRDDGAWELTALATPGYENSDAGYESFMKARTPAGLIINEVMTANSTYLPESGLYNDWVELKNSSTVTISLSGLYLTDDADEPKLWPLPDVQLAPGELYIVMCSGQTETLSRYPHAGFSLNAGEERLYIYDENGTALDYVLLTGLTREGSYGRRSGESGFCYFDIPTPGAENNGGARQVTDLPYSPTAQGVYEDADSLTVELLGEGVIYYTTDGSDPDTDSEIYGEPLVLTETTVIRARARAEGKLMSGISTQSYFLRTGHTLPVVSLVTDPDNLWDPEIGIHITGYHINYNQDWERDASITLFEKDGGGFSYDCGVKLHGATSRFVTQKKTFKIMFRGRYGEGTLNYDLFGDGEVTTFGSFLLRAGVDDVCPSFIKDDVFAILAKEGSDSLLSMNTRYCVLYINGEYWGLYCIREAMSEEYYASYYDVDPDTVTICVADTYMGTSYEEILRFVRNHNMSDDENYAWVEARVDVENLADWVIFEGYAANEDIWNNLRYYNSTQGDGKWRYALVDLDLSWLKRGYGFADTVMTGISAELPKALLANSQFRTLFMERTSELLNGVLADDNVLAVIEELAAEIRPEMEADRLRWDSSMKLWEGRVRELTSYVSGGRAATVAYSCAAYLNMSKDEIEYYFGEVLS